MARTVSLAAMTSALKQETDEVWVATMRITHPSISPDIFLCDNTKPVTVNGQLYQPFPFAFTMPPDEPEQEPTVNLTVSNVDRRLITDIRSIEGGPVLWMSLVLHSDSPVTNVEYGPVRLKATAVTYTADTITMTLGIDKLTGEPIPYLTFSPEFYPGLFG